MAHVQSWSTKLASTACHFVVLFAVALHVIEVFTSPWTAMGFVYLASAAVGIDALLVGVRKLRDEGPSIRNLTPGGWAMFAALFFVVAVPAYYVGARRRARRGYDAPIEPPGALGFVAIGALVLGGVALLLA